MATAAAVAAAAAATSPLTTVSYTSRTKRLSASISLPNSQTTKSPLLTSSSLLRHAPLPSWIGLKHLGISSLLGSRAFRGRCRGKAVYASLFGVGAPEALVIGVVALLVFGPKGLAEVARNLGKTLRAFQPTIKELQEVSREFKTTLEREIGLDEVQSSLQNSYRPSTSVNERPLSTVDQNGAQPSKASYSSEDLLKITEEQLVPSSGSNAQGTYSEEKLQAAETATAAPEAPGTGSIHATLEEAAATTVVNSTETSTIPSPTSSLQKSQMEQ